MGTEDGAQPRHQDGDLLVRTCRLVVAPQHVGCPVDGDGDPRASQQGHQAPTLAARRLMLAKALDAQATGHCDSARLHDLRHTYAAFCIASTADPVRGHAAHGSLVDHGDLTTPTATCSRNGNAEITDRLEDLFRRAGTIAGARGRIRTDDLLITSELLCRLSYPGVEGSSIARPARTGGRWRRRFWSRRDSVGLRIMASAASWMAATASMQDRGSAVPSARASP